MGRAGKCVSVLEKAIAAKTLENVKSGGENAKR